MLVDLFPVVKKSLRVGSRSYSIKKLEPLYMGDEVRTSDVQKGDEAGTPGIQTTSGRAERTARIVDLVGTARDHGVPVVFIQEEAGQLFRDISIALTLSFFFYLFVAPTVIPMLAACVAVSLWLVLPPERVVDLVREGGLVEQPTEWLYFLLAATFSKVVHELAHAPELWTQKGYLARVLTADEAGLNWRAS